MAPYHFKIKVKHWQNSEEKKKRRNFWSGQDFSTNLRKWQPILYTFSTCYMNIVLSLFLLINKCVIIHAWCFANVFNLNYHHLHYSSLAFLSWNTFCCQRLFHFIVVFPFSSWWSSTCMNCAAVRLSHIVLLVETAGANNVKSSFSWLWFSFGSLPLNTFL